MQDGITLRDLVNAIPLYAIKAGLLTVEKKGKKNVFSGRIGNRRPAGCQG
jgi:aconitate hydratase 2/2-methylisocitrate dehydratase